MAPSNNLSPSLPPSSPGGGPVSDQAPAATARTAWCLDLVLVTLLAALAFLLASFPARNSDLWGHLAAGRLLAQGEFPLRGDVDVRSLFPGDQAYLFDLLTYGLYSVVGGDGLMVCKALVAAGLALVLLRLGSAGHGWWISGVCSALALVALGPNFLLKPTTISYLMLGLALWFAWSRKPAPGHGRLSLLPPWPLLILFVFWANLDTGFVLGLRIVAVVWLGQVLEEAFTGKTWRGALRLLLSRAVSLVLLGAVCLITPTPVHAGTLLGDLSWFFPGSEPVSSPFQLNYLKRFVLTPPGMAYYALLGLGVLSFLLNLPRWPWHRFLPWFVLALLSAFHLPMVPFFAVVAGPVLALNLHEILAWSFDLRQPYLVRSLLTAALGLVLVLCAWTGWLQGAPYGPRRWTIETVPSLEQGAVVARQWQEAGKFAGGLHLSPETVWAFAWFCPAEKRVQDASLSKAIVTPPLDPEEVANWRKQVRSTLRDTMRSKGVNHVILYDANCDHLLAALRYFRGDPKEWPFLYQEGDLVVLGWRDPAGSGEAFRGQELDLAYQAFHPTKDRQAPEQPAEHSAEVRLWWDALWKPIPPRPIEAYEATLHLLHSEVQRQFAPSRVLSAWWPAQSAGLAGAAGGWRGPAGFLDLNLRLVLLQPQMVSPPPLDRRVLSLQWQFALHQDDIPPALLFLAIRGSRRALASNPEDAQAALVLGESYLRLLRFTRERIWARKMPELLQLRRCQASTALNRAIALKPDFAQAYLDLGGLYRELGYLDLALKHLQIYEKLTSGSNPAGLHAPKNPLQEELTRLAAEVDDRLNAYATESGGLRVMEKAELAKEKRLAGEALGLLRSTVFEAFGTQGLNLEVELLLGTGRSQDLVDMAPEFKQYLGTSYHVLRVQALAALGHYAQAEEECNALMASLGPLPSIEELGKFRTMLAFVVGQAVLDGHPQPGALADGFRRVYFRVQHLLRLQDLAQNMKRAADVAVLQGLLELEQGDTEKAEIDFRIAFNLWGEEYSPERGWTSTAALWPRVTWTIFA